jgi:hypothetical protein
MIFTGTTVTVFTFAGATAVLSTGTLGVLLLAAPHPTANNATANIVINFFMPFSYTAGLSCLLSRFCFTIVKPIEATIPAAPATAKRNFSHSAGASCMSWALEAVVGSAVLTWRLARAAVKEMGLSSGITGMSPVVFCLASFRACLS